MTKYGPDNPDATYVEHGYPEHGFDSGEVMLNYATAGSADKSAIVLVPAQVNSWWSYEAAMTLLADHFEVFAVDLRGQGRSTRTPGRYTLDNLGNDLVRFISGRVGHPVYVSGLSSGGLVAAWLSAYAPPGMILGACYEDPPQFSSEIRPPYGQSISQSIGPMFKLVYAYLGDQWSVGDWDGLQQAWLRDLPPALLEGLIRMAPLAPDDAPIITDEPPQNFKEYDPEWARAFWTGSVSASCDHAKMLAAVKVPVMFTHHFRKIDEATGRLQGAISDLQVRQVRELITAAGQRFDYQIVPGHGPRHARD